jgi:hypothetical protein
MFKIDRSYVEESLKISAKIKAKAEGLGAERMVVSRVLTGQYTGCWLVMTRAADMGTLDSILRSIISGPEFSTMLDSGKVELLFRNLMDIPDGF